MTCSLSSLLRRNTAWWGVVCCSVLQCVAVCGSVLQCVVACRTICHGLLVVIRIAINCASQLAKHSHNKAWWCAVCCSVLQCVAVCCSLLQCVVVCCSALQCVVACRNERNIHIWIVCLTNSESSTDKLPQICTNQAHPKSAQLQHATTHCNTLQQTATTTILSSIQVRSIATRYNTLQHISTHCNTLQHTATHCNNNHTKLNPRQTATHFNTLQHTATHCNTLQQQPY